MVEEPVVSVPVMASGSWVNEAAALAVAKAQTPAPFLSQVDGDEADEADEGFFFSSTPSVAGIGNHAAQVAATEAARSPEYGSQFGSGEPELVAAAVRPQVAEMAQMADEAPYIPLPRDYASDFGSGVRGAAEAEEHRAQPTTAVLQESDEQSHRDLDTPTFLRRLRF